jgi:hypothetical protein
LVTTLVSASTLHTGLPRSGTIGFEGRFDYAAIGTVSNVDVVLVRSHFGDVVMREPLRYALAVNPPVRVPVAFNGFALWNVIFCC